MLPTEISMPFLSFSGNLLQDAYIILQTKVLIILRQRTNYAQFWFEVQHLNPRPTKGGVVTTSLTVCLRLHKNAKESDPGHLGYLFYILCGHFDEKKNGGTPKDGGRVSCQSSKVGGGCHLKIF